MKKGGEAAGEGRVLPPPPHTHCGASAGLVASSCQAVAGGWAWRVLACGEGKDKQQREERRLEWEGGGDDGRPATPQQRLAHGHPPTLSGMPPRRRREGKTCLLPLHMRGGGGGQRQKRAARVGEKEMEGRQASPPTAELRQRAHLIEQTGGAAEPKRSGNVKWGAFLPLLCVSYLFSTTCTSHTTTYHKARRSMAHPVQSAAA